MITFDRHWSTQLPFAEGTHRAHETALQHRISSYELDSFSTQRCGMQPTRRAPLRLSLPGYSNLQRKGAARPQANPNHKCDLLTCLALARASVRSVENSEVSLSARWAKTACRLAVQLLVGIAQTAHQTAPHRIASHRVASRRSAPYLSQLMQPNCPCSGWKKPAQECCIITYYALPWFGMESLTPVNSEEGQF